MRIITSPKIAVPRAPFSPGILIDPGKRWLVLSGQVATDVDGNVPEGIEAQTRLTWENIMHLLRAADMDLSHVAKVTTYLTSSDLLPGFNTARSEILGDHRPASTLLIVSALVSPKFLVEVEVLAAAD